MSKERKWPVAIDPEGCGCTECLIGEYVPLEYATRKHYKRLKQGKIANNTYGSIKDVRRYLKAHYRWEV